MISEGNIRANGSASVADERVRSLMALIDELIAIVVEENNELAKGLPASRLKQVDEKNRLASLFEKGVAECSTKVNLLRVEDQMLRAEFLERIQGLRAAMDENLIRLRAAIDARNRRIDAVMHAMREQITKVSPYGARGRLTTPATCVGTNVRA